MILIILTLCIGILAGACIRIFMFINEQQKINQLQSTANGIFTNSLREKIVSSSKVKK